MLHDAVANRPAGFRGSRRWRVAALCWLLGSSLVLGSGAFGASALAGNGGSGTDLVARHLQFTSLGSVEGLSQDHVYDIVQDGRGFLWIATQEGLNRYDGYQVHSYEHRKGDPHSLSHDFVPTLMVDTEGVLWVGTARGVNRYDPATDTFRREPFPGPAPAGLADDHVTAMLQSNSGAVWIGTQDSGLVRVDPASGRSVRYRQDAQRPDGLPDDAIMSLLEDSRGELWIGTRHAGLVRFDAVAGGFVSYGAAADGRGLPGSEVRALMEDSRGSLWIGTADAGLIRFDPKQESYEQFRRDPASAASLADNRVRDILEDARGTIWIATDHGLAEWRPATRGFVSYVHDPLDPASLASNQVNTLFTDDSGVLWVGTWDGVSKWNYLSDTFSYYRAEDGLLPGNVVTSVAEDAEGSLWVATYGAGLGRLDPGSGEARFYRHDPADPRSLPDDRVMAVHVDPRGGVWLGTRAGGLARLDPATGQVRRFAHDPGRSTSLSANAVSSLHSDLDGWLWVGTFGGGLNRTRLAEPGEFERFTHDPEDPTSISGDKVLHVFADRGGQLWIGTDSAGLNRFHADTGRFERYRQLASAAGALSLDTVTDLMEDRAGSLWIGTLGQGLLRWTLQRREQGLARVDVFGKADGLPSDTIHGLLEGRRGALWLSSNRGLTRFNPKQGEVRQFDSRSGLRDNEFNQGASFRSRSGRLLFGSTGGLVGFYPDEVPVNSHLPKVYVSVRSRQQELASAATGTAVPQVEVGYLDRFLAFDFVALDFTSPDKNQYRYMLDGFDESWNDADDFRRASYTNLPAGDYTFRVQAANNDGLWNRDGASLAVTVVPPPWNSWWAYLSYLLLAGALLAGVVRSQRLKLQREAEQRELLQREVESRTRELAARNAELEELNDKLAEASVTDSLTGLRNRRFVDQFIHSEISLFERNQAELRPEVDGSGRERRRTMYFMMIDLDGFKLINDRFGHHAGDLALMQVTEILRACCRNSDTVIRWGGDEFMVIGFSSGFFGVKVLAERIREAIADYRYDVGNGNSGRLSASIGVAPYPLVDDRPGFCSWELVAAVADQAAYVAKANGGDAWVSISGTENLTAEMLARLNAQLAGFVEAGCVQIDSSVGADVVLPGGAEPAAVAGAAH